MQVPWTAVSTHPKLSLFDSFAVDRIDRYLSAAVTTGSIRVLLPDGSDNIYGTPGTCAAPCAVIPAFSTAAAFKVGSIATAAAAKPPEGCCGALDPEHPMIRMRNGSQEVPMDVFVRVLAVRAFTRVAFSGSVGLLQAYRDRDVEVSDVGSFAAVLMRNTEGLAAQEGLLGVLQWMGGAMLYSQLVQTTAVWTVGTSARSGRWTSLVRTSSLNI